MLRYAITDGRLALGRGEQAASHRPTTSPHATALDPRKEILKHAAFVASRQINFFLLREPRVSGGQLASLGRQLLRTFTGTSTRLLLHSRLDIAIATMADGVHLSSTPGELTPEQIRLLYTAARLPSPTISLSCHTEEDLHGARSLRPDLILFGPIFGKYVQGQLVRPGVGVEALERACRIAAPIPVLALGGITEANTSACLHAGAAGVAAIRLFKQSQIK